MRFFDREQEFDKLREIENLSNEVAQFTIITGRRRIGKTEMVKKIYENKTLLYFFVARKAEMDLCEVFIDEIRTKLNIPMIESKCISFAGIFRFIMELSQTQHITLFIDEFQDFYRVNPSIYSDMQNIWDSHKSKAHINLIVAGSVNTLMNKIFKDKKQPLFGRQTDTIHVRPFKPSVLKEIMSEYCPGYKKSDLLALYTLTGGVAKYVELFIDKKKFTEKKMMDMFFEQDSYFLSEGKNMLGQSIEEFISTLDKKNIFSVGVNCIGDVAQITPLIDRLGAIDGLCVSLYPNAGQPDINGNYSQTPEMMQRAVWPMLEWHRLNVIGGCCGTTPEHIAAVHRIIF